MSQTSLLLPVPASVPARLETPDAFNELARTVGKCPPGWRWNGVELIDSPAGFLITGAVSPDYTSGKRKGRPNWTKRDRGTERTIVIMQAQMIAFRAEWSASTGRCWTCAGNGTEYYGHGPGGPMYRDCRKCGATGRAK